MRWRTRCHFPKLVPGPGKAQERGHGSALFLTKNAFWGQPWKVCLVVQKARYGEHPLTYPSWEILPGERAAKTQSFWTGTAQEPGFPLGIRLQGLSEGRLIPGRRCSCNNAATKPPVGLGTWGWIWFC